MNRNAVHRTRGGDIDRYRKIDRNRLAPGFLLANAEPILCCVALLSVALAYIAGTACAGIFIASFIALILFRPVTSINDIFRFWWLIVLPIFATMSAIWSDAPGRSLRAGIQLLLTISAMIIICRRMPIRLYIGTIFSIYLILCLTALASSKGNLTQDSPLVWLFHSKNQLAFAAYIVFSSGLAIAFHGEQNRYLRLLGLGASVISVVVLALAQSAGAEISFAITLVTFPILCILGRLNFKARVVTVIGSLSLLPVAALLGTELAAYLTDFRTNVLKKDATLTGRTYLWDFAHRLSVERPTLGHGYYAFWRQGNIDAEGLWRWGGIASRTGFNFHNSFIEMRVDLGWVGVVLLAMLCAVVMAASIYRFILTPSIPRAFFISSLFVLYVRSYAESGLIAPFNIFTCLWVASAVYSYKADVNSSERNSGVRGPDWLGRASRFLENGRSRSSTIIPRGQRSSVR